MAECEEMTGFPRSFSRDPTQGMALKFMSEEVLYAAQLLATAKPDVSEIPV